MQYILLISIVLGFNVVKAGKPHIVFILADDLGYNDIGYHARRHDSQMKTPHLNDLAAKGVKLENYYVQPICTPSRSQIMSGRYQIHTGLQHGVLDAGQKNGLPLDNILLPEQLRNCGYDTHMVGKWHLGDYEKEFLPQFRGFNSYFGYLNGAEDYYAHSFCNEKISACGVDMHDTYGPLNSTWGEYSAFTFTDRAKRVIDERDKAKPLFLYLAYQSVHFPMQAPERFVKPFMHIKDKTRRTYAGMLAGLDEAVMNVTKHLIRSGIYNDTIIIFSTDNGGHNAYGGNNWPLRGRKNTLWEGGVKGVGFVSGGRIKQSGIESYNFMHVSDWLPTMLGASKCPKVPGSQPLDGFDQWKAILQKEPSPRTDLLHNIDPLKGKPIKSVVVDGVDITIHSAIRSGPWKLLTGNPGFDEWVKPPELDNIVSKSYPSDSSKAEWVYPNDKLDDYTPRIAKVQLYHIDTDPYERDELSHLFPHVVSDLLHKLSAYNATAVPCRFPPADKKSDPRYHGGYWVPWVTK